VAYVTILTVGSNQQFATLTAAVAASHDGDIIQVQAGTHTNDFPGAITTKISIVGVGGLAHFVATQAPPNGKAILVTRNDVTIDHMEFSGVAVPDGNGAGIRFEGGNLTITNSYFHDNEDGILSGTVAGNVTIDNSEFSHNGSGDGFTHNIYIGHISNLTITDSYIHDAVIGHEVKSRADVTVLTNNRIVDGTGSASYSIDLPNGGNAKIQNNVIEQGPNSDNRIIIDYAEETSSPWAGSQLIVDGNTILNDQPGNPVAVSNTTSSVTAQITTLGPPRPARSC
jgi:hypothetical protein